MKKLKVTKKNKVKTRPIPLLIKDLDKIFSLYIRLKYSKDGLATCVTCGKTAHFKDMQNGHFNSRIHYATRWLEENCHPQCVGCNVFKNGNMANYAEFMIKKYGVEIISELNKKKHETTKLDRKLMEEKISFYKKKVKELEYFNY